MKKRGLFCLLLIAIFLLPFVLADEQSQILDAYSCLEEEIETKTCEDLTLEEKAFSFLAMEKCETEFLESSSNECFPDGDCDLTLTSKSAIALELKGKNTENYSSWVSDRKIISDSLEWFLQVDTSSPSSCEINNSEEEYSINIQENKEIDSSENSDCFSISSNEYWVKVDSSCYNKEMDVTCDQDFRTTLLFKSPDSGENEINLFDRTKSASSGSTINEKIKSSCLSNPSSNSCNYESTLWSSVFLDMSGEEIQEYLPYLISMKDSNSNYFPEIFLSYLINEDVFTNSVNDLQYEEGYWNVSGNEHYDTSLAMIFLQSNSNEKQNAMDWLLETQEENGCFVNESIKENSLILYSGWPEYLEIYNDSLNQPDEPDEPSEEVVCGDGIINESEEECEPGNLSGNVCSDVVEDSEGDLDCYPEGHENECMFNVSACEGGTAECSEDNPCPEGSECSEDGRCLIISDEEDENETTSGTGTEEESCIDEGYHCLSKSACSNAEGEVLDEFSCTGISYCCSEEKFSCQDEGGSYCASDQICDGETKAGSCCMGTCVLDEQDSSSDEGDICETDSDCFSNEECVDGTCVLPASSEDDENNTLWWIVLALIILIGALVFVFIKYKDKIFKKKSSKGPKRKRPFRPAPPKRPRPMRKPSPHQINRKVNSNKTPPKRPPQNNQNQKPTKSSSEFDNVMKKLKEMGS